MRLRIEGIAGGANSLPRVSRSPGLYAQLIYRGYGIYAQEEIALKIEFSLFGEKGLWRKKYLIRLRWSELFWPP